MIINLFRTIKQRSSRTKAKLTPVRRDPRSIQPRCSTRPSTTTTNVSRYSSATDTDWNVSTRLQIHSNESRFSKPLPVPPTLSPLWKMSMTFHPNSSVPSKSALNLPARLQQRARLRRNTNANTRISSIGKQIMLQYFLYSIGSLFSEFPRCLTILHRIGRRRHLYQNARNPLW